MLISESDEGLSTSCTRQCAGIVAGGAPGRLAPQQERHLARDRRRVPAPDLPPPSGGCDRGLIQFQAGETLAGSGGRRGAEQYDNDAADHGTPPGRATRHGSRSVSQSGLLPYRSLTAV